MKNGKCTTKETCQYLGCNGNCLKQGENQSKNDGDDDPTNQWNSLVDDQNDSLGG